MSSSPVVNVLTANSLSFVTVTFGNGNEPLIETGSQMLDLNSASTDQDPVTPNLPFISRGKVPEPYFVRSTDARPEKVIGIPKITTSSQPNPRIQMN